METKQLFLDLETTGNDHKIHGIRQIAAVVYVGGVEVDTFNSNVAPLTSDIIDRNAMISLGVDVDKISDAPDAFEVKKAFEAFMAKHVEKYARGDKFYLLGYNVRFDEDFLRDWFIKTGDKYFGSWFWTPAIDVMGLAADAVMRWGCRPKMENFKLGTVCKTFGVELSNAHDALADIRATAELYDKINRPLMVITTQEGESNVVSESLKNQSQGESVADRPPGIR